MFSTSHLISSLRKCLLQHSLLQNETAMQAVDLIKLCILLTPWISTRTFLTSRQAPAEIDLGSSAGDPTGHRLGYSFVPPERPIKGARLRQGPGTYFLHIVVFSDIHLWLQWPPCASWPRARCKPGEQDFLLLEAHRSLTCSCKIGF